MARKRSSDMPTPNFIGQIAVFRQQPDPEDRSDYRAVPASDSGNNSYSDQGRLGTWSEPEPYSSPSDVRYFAGYGASEADLRRGYCEPTMREDAAYDLANYKDRSTLPKMPDVDDNPATLGASDMEFRGRGERSRGFFTRPKIPTDR